MYKILALILAVVVFTSCNKDSYTSEPQLKFIGFSPEQVTSVDAIQFPPKLVVEITDEEGDVGLLPKKDTSKIYIKSLFTNHIDSFKIFPDFSAVATKKLKVTAEISLKDVLPPARPSGKVDSLRFEVYITDFADHKSNVLYTDKPLIYRTP